MTIFASLHGTKSIKKITSSVLFSSLSFIIISCGSNCSGFSYSQVSTMEKQPLVVKKFSRDYTFGWEFFKSLYKLLPYFYPSLEWAFIFTIVVVGFRGLSEFLTNHIGNIPGDMYLALIEKDKHKFWNTFINGVIMYLAKCGTLALINLAAWFLYIAYRRNLVSLLHERYFRNNVYYKLNCVNSEGIDNPYDEI